jgi:hypothetical protein
MSVVNFTGEDVIKINGRLLNDLMDGDCAALVHPNDISVVKIGKNGNAIVSFKYDGKVVEVTLRVLLGTADDKFLNNLCNLYLNDPVAFTMFTGEFSKQIGDGAGNITSITYVLSGGVIKKLVDQKENAEGDSDQGVAPYSLIFTGSSRSIG